jgi:predicted NAD/FAD-dependent oxidoreductase
VVSLIDSLKLARNAGYLQSHQRPVAAYCTVQDSEFAGWLAIESAKQVNTPEVYNTLISELSTVWEGWEEVGEEFAPVVAAYTTFRGH